MQEALGPYLNIYVPLHEFLFWYDIFDNYAYKLALRQCY
jgi:hypothetical protein